MYRKDILENKSFYKAPFITNERDSSEIKEEIIDIDVKIRELREQRKTLIKELKEQKNIEYVNRVYGGIRRYL